MDEAKYRMRIFSHRPGLSNLTEEEAINHYIELAKTSVSESFSTALFEDEDSRAVAVSELREQDGVYVFAQEIKTNKIVGMGAFADHTDFSEYNGTYLTHAYVVPEHRENKIYTALLKKRIDISHSLGIPELFLEPADYGFALAPLTREGFEPVRTSDGRTILRRENPYRIMEGRRPSPPDGPRSRS